MGFDLAYIYGLGGERYEAVVVLGFVGLEQIYKSPHCTSFCDVWLRSTSGANLTEYENDLVSNLRYLCLFVCLLVCCLTAHQHRKAISAKKRC